MARTTQKNVNDPGKAADCNFEDHGNPDEIDRCTRHERAEMNDTLKRIEHKLSPVNLFDQGMGYLRQNYRRQMAWISNFPDRMNKNPAPFVIIGAGMLLGGLGMTGYLLSKRRKKNQPIASERLPRKRRQMLPAKVSASDESIAARKKEVHLRADPAIFAGTQENQASTEEIVRDQTEPEKEVPEQSEPLIIRP